MAGRVVLTDPGPGERMEVIVMEKQPSVDSVKYSV